MKLQGRIQVEQLDDERMTNIERRVVAGAADAAARPVRAPRPRWGLAFAAAAVAATVAFAAGYKLRGTPAEAPAAVAAADTRVAIADGTLDIGDATIHSTPGTVYDITRPDGGVLVGLAKGKVELAVKKRGNRPPLVVRAGETDVIVVGTHFSVDWDGTGDVDVRVTEGIVKVVRHHEEFRVAAGSAWEPKRGVIALADARPLANGTTEVAAAGGATIGDVPASGSGAYEIDMGAGPDVLHGRTAQVPDEHTPGAGNGRTVGAGSGSRPESGARTPSTGGGTGSAAKPIGGSALQRLVLEQALAPALDVNQPVAADAVSSYQQLIVKEKGETESRAYYGIALLQATKMGRTGDALMTIDAYQRRFAQGRVYPERAEMAWLKVRILCTPPRRIDDTCRAAAASYLRVDPDETPRHHVADRVTAGE